MLTNLSKKEIELISKLEFARKYFFTAADVDNISKNKTQRYNIIKNLLKKKRIVKLNRYKYYLVPIKARTGLWTEDSLILADEMFNGKDYFVGGWAAASYYHLTEQIPMQTDIYTTRRQGKKLLFNHRYVFHRTTKEKTKRAVIKTITGHTFKIIPKTEAKKWMRLRE